MKENHSGQNFESINSSPIIRLTENREALAVKLEEYKSRLKPYNAPEQQFGTLYKIAITQELVDRGEVDTRLLSNQLEEKYGSFDLWTFENACRVIADYVKTGGQRVHGGTGLPKVEEM